MTSDAKTVEEYLASLPEDRRQIVSAIRDAINSKLPEGYEEGVQYGGISWHVPHSIFPAGYHCNPKEPLYFAGLVNQKHHVDIHMFCLYMNEDHLNWFKEAYAAAGKKLDMGKSCVRVKKLEDVPLDVFSETISRIPVKQYLDRYTQAFPVKEKKKRA